ncbi:hypothetical protein [Streptomyces sp. NPDC005953]|uniref:hypothetical protein n=1 Tax=Streptomyces sp. NPDC005953 TaxID=3156719 RepID=UPI0033F2522D
MVVSKGMKVAIMTGAAAAIASTPLYWLLGGPDSGRLVAASVQGATGVIALVWSLFTSPGSPEPRTATDAVDIVSGSGRASASDGGTAVSGGVRGSVADSIPMRVQDSGKVTAEGPGSFACSGVYSADKPTT